MTALLAGRFSVEEPIATGGMGTIHRGRDTTSGRPVAIKLLREVAMESRARLAREARSLEELAHPHVVRHVAHGVSDAGEPFLVMEWIEGETLSARLAREPLSTSESVQVARCVADALAHVHAAGLVHRDVKPGNIILRDGRLDGATLVDFGLARMPTEESLARTGTILGTLAYMAPEQARGEHDIRPAADVFALGCVLYRCVTGRRAFDAADGLAILAKVLLDDPPPPSELAAGLDPRVEALILRMLAKEPPARFADGGAVWRALADLGVVANATPSSPTARVGVDERLLRTVVFAAVSIDRDATLGREDPLAAIRRLAARFGDARCEVIASGAVVITFLGGDSAKERAVRAAACAIDLAELVLVPVSIATGHAHSGGGARVSRPPLATDVFDRAAALARDAGRRAVVVDDTTAALVGERYAVTEDRELLEVSRDEDTGRRLLGKVTPFVGRERERTTLSAVIAESERESVARAALVTGPPGIGKSRLRREVVASLRAEGHALVLLGGGDLLRRGAPWSGLARALGSLIGAAPSERPSAKAARLESRVRRSVAEADADRVADFLSELCALEAGPLSSRRAAARGDPVLMHEHVSRALCDFFEAECAARPVVLVLEDVQWMDALSLRLVDALLGALALRPLTVLAFARPELFEGSPGLWATRAVIPLPLGPLSRRASEALVRGALEDASDEVVRRVAARAGGNPLYLEELVRAEHDGRGADPPDTVLAMVESRLAQLAPEARRVLRGASLFGGPFSLHGLGAVLADEEARAIEAHTRDLVRLEVLVESQGDLAFRDALLRDAAYGTLTDEDARAGHGLVARWMESRPNPDWVVLAEHLSRSDEPARAIEPLLRCAQLALDASDLASALALAGRARALGATARAALVESEAHRWLGQTAKAHEAAREALSDPSEPHRLAALRALAYCASYLGRREELEGVFHELMDHRPSAEGLRPWALAACQAATSLAIVGRTGPARRLIERVEPRAADPLLRARLFEARVACASFSGDLEALLDLVIEARVHALHAHDERAAIVQGINTGFALMQLGDYAHALESFEQARRDSERLNLVANRRSAAQNAGYVLLRLGRLEEARALEQTVLAEVGGEASPRLVALARACLALVEHACGDARTALAHAEAAVASATGSPQEAYARAALAQVTLASDPAGALAHAERALALIGAFGAHHFAETGARVARAEALRALGRHAEARAAIAEARADVLGRAARLSPGRRDTFTTCVEENRRALELADAWR